MPKNFSELELRVRNLFKVGDTFSYFGNTYTILVSGKPKPSDGKGECKTDVYILTKDELEIKKEFKISVKKSNYEFIENKINKETASSLFGQNWSNFLIKYNNKIKSDFDIKKLIFLDKFGNTQKGSITLGWKFELLKCKSNISNKIDFTNDQKKEIYSGSNLPSSKKNSKINNILKSDSGVANFIMEIGEHDYNLQEAINLLETIDEHVKKVDICFACKALNLRVLECKWDGDRPLSIYVNWFLNNGKLAYNIDYTQPLLKKGDEIAKNVLDLLCSVSINSSNFNKIEQYIIDKNILFKKS